MKLLMVTPYFYPKIGGLENYALNIALKLKNNYGWEIIVVTSNHLHKKYQIDDHEGIKIYRLPIWLKLSNTPINFAWLPMIRKIIKLEKPDAINAHSPVPFIADMAFLARGRLPFLLTYHSGSMKKGQNVADILIALYETFVLPHIFRGSNRIICFSKEFISRYLTKFEDKVIPISPGVNTDTYIPPKVNINNKEVLYIGRIEKNSEWKGIIYLIKAFKIALKSIPDLKLTFVGSGDAVETYKLYVKEIGIDKQVDFVGQLHGVELIKAFQKATVLVLPSITNAESFGMSLAEAMSCGIPVIGTNVGGVPQVIDHDENGLLVKPKDALALSDAIVKIVGNTGLAYRFGINGRNKVLEKFSLDKKVEQFVQITKKALSIYQITSYYPPHLGGMEKCVKKISEHLSKEGYTVTVITSNIGAGNLKVVKEGNLTVRYLPSIEIAHTPVTLSLVKALWQVPRHAVIHLHVANAFFPEITYLIAKLKNRRYVVHFHLDVPASGMIGFLLPLYKKIILKQVINGATSVICLTASQKKFVQNYYQVPDSKIKVIPNGVSSIYFDLTRAENPERINVLYVGRLSKQKNLLSLLEAMKELDEMFILHIVGEGTERNSLENFITNNKLSNVILHGQKSDNDLLTHYQNADIFVLPSKIEGMSLAMLEAMAAELPIITADLPEIREILDDGALYVKNSTEITDAIKSLSRNAQLRKKMAIKNRNKARKYSWNEAVTNIENTYNQI